MNMTSPAIIPLGRLMAAEQAHAGAKAANCARLQQAGFPVPDGLVVMAHATARDLATIAAHPWFDGLPEDTRFAVRSSGIGEDGEGESFAGIHDTVLDVPREGLAAAIDTCLASSRAPRALEYRRARGLSSETIEMALLIQRMVHPIAAGVAFTVNPVSGAEHEIVINSSWGLGDALVSGRIEPDEFVINKRDGTLTWSRLGQKGDETGEPIASLSAERLRELAAMLAKIEQHYGSPQDVEWCLDDDGLWIVQSRPVTTRRAKTQEIEWTRANFAEVLPDLTSPQALDAFEDLLTRAERLYLGGLMGDEATYGPVVKIFYGRMHFNLTQLRRICAFGGVAPAEILRSMGHADTIQPADEVVTRPSLASLKYAPDFARLLWQHLTIARVIRAHETVAADYMRQLAAIDPRTMPDAELWSGVEHWIETGPEFMQTVLLLTNVTVHESPVRRFCERVGFPFEQLVYPQLAIGQRSVSAQQAFDLVDLAEAARREPSAAEFLARDDAGAADLRTALAGTAFLAAFDRFIERYGHRGRYESDWALPRYKDDPTPILKALRAHLMESASPDSAATVARQEQAARGAWTALEQRLSWWQRATKLPAIKRSIRRIKQYYLWREQVRSDLIRLLAMLRPWHLVLADRFVERGWIAKRDDYFLLKLREIGAVIRGETSPHGLRAIAAERTGELARYAAIEMPLLMRPSELASLIRRAGVSGGIEEGALTGHAVSGGCVEGEVVVVRDPGDFGRMKRGAILVAPATDPSWTPLFTLASGVIVEVGGVLSHASTIAREYGLPAVANVKNATKRLRTGERVRLDADNGIVHRLPQQPVSLAS